jgi:hypothetical protein
MHKGGEKLGEGKSGVVYDMCDADDYENNIETFCNYFGTIVVNTTNIDLHHIPNDGGGQHSDFYNLQKRRNC